MEKPIPSLFSSTKRTNMPLLRVMHEASTNKSRIHFAAIVLSIHTLKTILFFGKGSHFRAGSVIHCPFIYSASCLQLNHITIQLSRTVLSTQNASSFWGAYHQAVVFHAAFHLRTFDWKDCRLNPELPAHQACALLLSSERMMLPSPKADRWSTKVYTVYWVWQRLSKVCNLSHHHPSEYL